MRKPRYAKKAVQAIIYHEREELMADSQIITLSQRFKCKCTCQAYMGDNNKKYWYRSTNNTVYSTDCHYPNPVKAIGIFSINKLVINQL